MESRQQSRERLGTRFQSLEPPISNPTFGDTQTILNIVRYCTFVYAPRTRTPNAAKESHKRNTLQSVIRIRFRWCVYVLALGGSSFFAVIQNQAHGGNPVFVVYPFWTIWICPCPSKMNPKRKMGDRFVCTPESCD